MLDVVISASLAILMIVMTYLGIHVTLHPPNESPRAQRWYKTGFLVCGIAAVLLVVTQGIRANKSQRAATGQIVSLRQDVREAKNEATTASSEAESARREVQNESGRRQQAEKDLATIIQSTGKATRAGIAQDLRKIPLKVEVTGKPADTPERKKVRDVLGTFVRDGMKIRDQLGSTSTISVSQVEIDGQKWFDAVQAYLLANLGSSYVSQFLLTNTELSPSDIPPEKLPLWHGLNERIQTLNKFIDELK
jgi:hypothetical protein